MIKKLKYYKRFLELLWSERVNPSNRQKFRRIMRKMEGLA